MSARILTVFTDKDGNRNVYDWTDNQRLVETEMDLSVYKEGVILEYDTETDEAEYRQSDEGDDFSLYKVDYPHDQLRVNGIIDKVCPIAKGSRALIRAGVNVGKTTLIKMMAESVAQNHPEVKQFALLIDERPEEVSDFEDNFKGKTISSTFDMSDDDHIFKAEMTLEVCKRLVENGEDVVLYIDSITRLGRSYSNESGKDEKILTGGVTAKAIHHIREFLGAARCFKDHKGSLTVVATVLEGTGSKADEYILQELIGTGNCIIQLDESLAVKGYFPAVNVIGSKTRNDELIRPRNPQVQKTLEVYSRMPDLAYARMANMA